MYKQIIDPITGKVISVNDPKGAKILKNYINIINQKGGEDDDDKDGYKGNKKGKDGKDFKPYKKIVSKSDEAIDEVIEGPKEVSGFFGNKVKKGFSDFFGWKKKSPKNNLQALDKRLIKNIFDSDDTKDADFKFASKEAAEVASKQGFNVDIICSALFTMGQERVSKEGWTKREVLIAGDFIKSWNKKHPKDRWQEMTKKMNRKEPKKKGILGWLSKKTGQARESLLGFLTDHRSHANVKISLKELETQYNDKLSNQEKEFKKKESDLSENLKKITEEKEKHAANFEKVKKENDSNSENLTNLEKKINEKNDKIETLTKARNIAIDTHKDNILTINSQHKENINLKKNLQDFQKKNIPKDIILKQNKIFNKKIGKANKKIRSLIEKNIMLSNKLERRGINVPNNFRKLEKQDAMLDLNYEMQKYNNMDGNNPYFKQNENSYLVKKAQIQAQRELLNNNKNNTDFLIDVFDEDDLLETKKEYAVKRSYFETKQQMDKAQNDNIEVIDDDTYQHEGSINKDSKHMIVSPENFNHKMTKNDIIVINDSNGEPEFNQIDHIEILNENDNLNQKGGDKKYTTKADPIKYKVVFKKPFDKRYHNPNMIIATDSKAYGSFEKMGKLNITSWKKVQDKNASDAASAKSAEEKALLEKLKADAVKTHLEADEKYQAYLKAQKECEGKSPNSPECKAAEKAKEDSDAAKKNADDAAKANMDEMMGIGKDIISGDFKSLKEKAWKKGMDKMSKADTQQSTMGKVGSFMKRNAATGIGLAAVAGLGVTGKVLLDKYYYNNFINFLYLYTINKLGCNMELGDLYKKNDITLPQKGGNWMGDLGKNIGKFAKKGFDAVSKSSKGMTKKMNIVRKSKKISINWDEDCKKNVSDETKALFADKSSLNEIYSKFTSYAKKYDMTLENYNNFVIKFNNFLISEIKTDDNKIKNFINGLNKIKKGGGEVENTNCYMDLDTKGGVIILNNLFKKTGSEKIKWEDMIKFSNEEKNKDLKDKIFDQSESFTINFLKEYLIRNRDFKEIIGWDGNLNTFQVIDNSKNSIIDISKLKFERNEDHKLFLEFLINNYQDRFYYIYGPTGVNYNSINLCNYNNDVAWYKIGSAFGEKPLKIGTEIEDISQKIIDESSDGDIKILIIKSDA
jgi:hypothetical protein